MVNLFNCCYKLKYLNMSHFKTENLISVWKIFRYCKSLTSINLSNFNLEKVNSFYQLFEGCENLEEIDLSYNRAPSLKYIIETFKDCKNLKRVLLPTHIAGIISLTQTFYNCHNLEYINLTSFQGTKNLQNLDYMLYNCSPLKNIEFPYINAFDLKSTNY